MQSIKVKAHFKFTYHRLATHTHTHSQAHTQERLNNIIVYRKTFQRRIIFIKSKRKLIHFQREVKVFVLRHWNVNRTKNNQQTKRKRIIHITHKVQTHTSTHLLFHCAIYLSELFDTGVVSMDPYMKQKIKNKIKRVLANKNTAPSLPQLRKLFKTTEHS